MNQSDVSCPAVISTTYIGWNLTKWKRLSRFVHCFIVKCCFKIDLWPKLHHAIKKGIQSIRSNSHK